MQAHNLKVYNLQQVEDDRPMFFFQCLKEAAQKAGMSIVDLSHEIRIPSGHIYAWQKPIKSKGYRRPTEEHLQAIAGVEQLGLTMPVLLAWEVLDRYPVEAITKAYEMLAEKDKQWGADIVDQAVDIKESKKRK